MATGGDISSIVVTVNMCNGHHLGCTERSALAGKVTIGDSGRTEVVSNVKNGWVRLGEGSGTLVKDGRV